LPITVVVGVVTTLIVSNKERLEASRAALQTQRLERERAEKLAAEAQLASLSSRVQPHFLFNTLNSIAALIRENPEQAEQTVQRLASLLRSSLDQTQTIPLEQEIKLVRDYLEIQKTRLGERLHFEIVLEPGLQAAVPPFSVQTLVENSVKHVAGRRQEGVDLQIRASRFGDHVIVFVTDNGPGFDAGSIKAGHGLDNLQARLRAVYGNRAGLEFLREPGRMIVRMRLPIS
jgi:LytS/YehU family sensor histidine kinase